MTFLHPEFIYLMLPVLLILFGLLLTQSDAQEFIFAPESLAKLRVDTDQLSAKVRNLFYFLMFLFIILALAGPVIEKGSAKVKVKDDLFFVALDISDSMLCEDVYPNRLELGKKKIVELLQKEKKSRVGLIAFANSSYLVSPPTFDHKILTFLLKPMSNSYTSEHGTNILNVLKAANKQLENSENKKLLIVSDGGDKGEFSEEITYVKKEGIKVYVLSIGTQRGGVIEREDGLLRHQGEVVISRVNRAIDDLAKESGGAVVDSGELSPFLESMEADSLEEDQKPIYFHFFILPIGLAMLMFLIATSSFHRGEKYHLPSLIVLVLMSVYPPFARAELFDYQRLERADEAYKQEDYRVSTKSYEYYALEHESVEAAYNAANGYYKMGRYKMAVGLYESIYFVEADKNHQLYHNLGNAFAKFGTETGLKKAIEAYDKALKFREDNETRENLEWVKKALKKSREERQKDLQPDTLLGSSPSKPLLGGRNNEAGKEVSASNSMHYAERTMSDREAKKWLKLLDTRQHGQNYKIEVANPDEGAESEKPW